MVTPGWPCRAALPASHHGQWNANFAAFCSAFAPAIAHNRSGGRARLSCLHIPKVQERFMSESEEFHDGEVRDGEVRDARGRFVKGHPGGPGRPRNPVAVAISDLDRLGVEVAKRLIGVVAEQALQGNLRAAEMVLQRVWPVRRNRPVEIIGPDQELDHEPYAITEHRALASAMLEGQIAPQEAQAAARVLKSLQEQMEAVEESTGAISYSRGKW
jgi:hypothetical protein